MKNTFHTMMLTVAAVGLTAGGAMAADDTINSSAGAEPAAQTQVQAQAAAEASPSSAGQVESVQAKLKAEGFPVSVDGVWGPQSAEALRQFQQANSLDASGQIDAQTLTAMNIDASASSGTAMGESRNW